MDKPPLHKDCQHSVESVCAALFPSVNFVPRKMKLLCRVQHGFVDEYDVCVLVSKDDLQGRGLVGEATGVPEDNP